MNKQFYIDFQCQNITKRYSENRENAYLAMKNPRPTSAHFTRMTLLCYVGNICYKKFGAPP